MKKHSHVKHSSLFDAISSTPQKSPNSQKHTTPIQTYNLYMLENRQQLIQLSFQEILYYNECYFTQDTTQVIFVFQSQKQHILPQNFKISEDLAKWLQIQTQNVDAMMYGFKIFQINPSTKVQIINHYHNHVICRADQQYRQLNVRFLKPKQIISQLKQIADIKYYLKPPLLEKNPNALQARNVSFKNPPAFSKTLSTVQIRGIKTQTILSTNHILIYLIIRTFLQN
eukprot:TRINITY_DN4356_c0_g1_i6.p1 TRINITY_DN4356_c0_g1~~TRINITY_DN4356_c0_g1_i6.p1  ORF type:complete len:227 (+),score=-11.54 TRINITY_DN4356_c0_g1_i6:337-1017(+)